MTNPIGDRDASRIRSSRTCEPDASLDDLPRSNPEREPTGGERPRSIRAHSSPRISSKSFTQSFSPPDLTKGEDPRSPPSLVNEKLWLTLEGSAELADKNHSHRRALHVVAHFLRNQNPSNPRSVWLPMSVSGDHARRDPGFSRLVVI